MKKISVHDICMLNNEYVKIMSSEKFQQKIRTFNVSNVNLMLMLMLIC